jgi:hypothetical protein
MPHESTFSHAFDEFARMELPQFMHETLIRETQKERLICHIARDSTAMRCGSDFLRSAAVSGPGGESESQERPKLGWLRGAQTA